MRGDNHAPQARRVPPRRSHSLVRLCCGAGAITGHIGAERTGRAYIKSPPPAFAPPESCRCRRAFASPCLASSRRRRRVSALRRPERCCSSRSRCLASFELGGQVAVQSLKSRFEDESLIGRTDLSDCARLCAYPVDLIAPAAGESTVQQRRIAQRHSHDGPRHPNLARVTTKPAQANAHKAVISAVSRIDARGASRFHRLSRDSSGFLASLRQRPHVVVRGFRQAEGVFSLPDVENATISRSGSGVITKRAGTQMERLIWSTFSTCRTPCR